MKSLTVTSLGLTAALAITVACSSSSTVTTTSGDSGSERGTGKGSGTGSGDDDSGTGTGKGSGTGSGDDGSGSTIICVENAFGSSYCMTYTHVPSSVTAGDICGSNMVVAACSTTGVAGCCESFPLTNPSPLIVESECYYDVGDGGVGPFETECSGRGGTWVLK